MFDRIRNVFFFSCLLCCFLPLLTGCSGQSKIGDKWTKVTAGITTDSTTGITTVVVEDLDKNTEYEFRLSAGNRFLWSTDTFKAIILSTKTQKVGDVDEVKFKVAKKTGNSATLTWNDDTVVDVKTKESGNATEIKFNVTSKTDNSVTLTWDENIVIDAKTKDAKTKETVGFKVASKTDTSVTLTWNKDKTQTFKLEARKSSGAGSQIPEVIVDSVAQEDVQLYIYTDGRTVPSNFVEIRTRVSGYLEQFFFQPGAIVNEGDRLALVEQATYQVSLDAAKAGLANSKAQAALAEANLARAKLLVESGSITAQEYQTYEANRDMTLAAVELANTNVRNAELNLQYTDMRAPITGKTTKYLVDLGNFVSPTGAQSVLLSITQLDPMFVEFKISDRHSPI